MPQIIVMADARSDRREDSVMFTERVSVNDFESEHFQTQLVERLGWAVGDADAVERDSIAQEDAIPQVADDWDDPREDRGSTMTPPATPAASPPERPRRGRLSAVGPMS
ncbi:MAG: hypothetical protein QOF83_3436 [Solirubrobacteraceae bacterium]|jgi:hypothetical protein|nr:hypothetical protein [Solirubrobacteraceae bacterium]